LAVDFVAIAITVIAKRVLNLESTEAKEHFIII